MTRLTSSGSTAIGHTAGGSVWVWRRATPVAMNRVVSLALVALVLVAGVSGPAAAQGAPAAKPAAAKKLTKAEEEAARAAAAADEEAKKKAAEEEARAKADADAKAAVDAAAKATAAEDDAAAAEAKKAKEKALAARGLDARIRALADALAIPLKRLPGDHRDQRFAVVPFENAGAEASEKSLGLVVSDLVTTDLARDHRLGLVERSQLSKLMDEQALQQSGAIDDAQAVALGKLSGARGLIVGRVADAGEEFIVSARAIDGETGAVLVAEDVKLPKAELVAFSANAVVLRSRSGAMFRSMVVPGWGQSYNDQTMKGVIMGSATGGLAVATVVTGAVGVYTGFVAYPAAGITDDIAKKPAEDRPAAVAAVRDAANAELTAAGVLAGITIAAWGLTVADAWLSGVDTESLDAALAKN